MTQQFPAIVMQTLAQRFNESIRPFCIEVDSKWIIRSIHGFRLESLKDCQAGDSLTDRYPVVFGLGHHQPIELKMVQVNRQEIIDLHVIPGPESTFVLMFDVSSQFQAEVELQQKSNEIRLLEYRMRKLNRQLELANREAEKASQMKSQFIAGMSHEFRTPLTSILGYCDILENESETSNPRLLGIRKSSNHLLSLVDNLLEHGRVVSDTIEARQEKVNLPALFDSLRMIFEPLAAQEGLHFEIVCQSCNVPDILTDNVRLRQIIVNLISNAIRYTESGWIKVIWQQKSNRLMVSVKDSGPGISQADQDRIFNAFTQLSGSTGSKGLGLGLSISKHLTEILGGKLVIESEVGKGSTFSFSIDAKPCIEIEQEEQPVAASGNRVLIIEDDEDVLEYIQMFLSEYALDITTTGKLVDAIRIISSGSVDLVLSDLNLDDNADTDVVSKIRETDASIPIVIMSASNLEQDRQNAEEQGCSAYFTKPFDISLLADQIKSLLKGHD